MQSVWVEVCGITHIVVMSPPPWLLATVYTALRRLALDDVSCIPPSAPQIGTDW